MISITYDLPQVLHQEIGLPIFSLFGMHTIIANLSDDMISAWSPFHEKDEIAALRGRIHRYATTYKAYAAN
jgi:hypothetical protein